MYTPLPLQKLCCNIIVKEIYNKNFYIFNHRLKKLNLFDDFNKMIKDRYFIIRHILNYEKNNQE